MHTHETILKLSDPMLKAACDLARKRDLTVGQVIRDALAAELRRASRNARTPDRADETLIAPVRALLASDIARATGWADLDRRLKAKGYAFRPAGGGLALHSHPDGARVCKASELGQSYGALMRRFGKPFPDHPLAAHHGHLLRPAPAPVQEVIEF